VPHSNLFIKNCRKQRRKEQSRKASGSGKLYEIHEGNCRFLVNFTDYQDTGLSLIQRKTRGILAGLADGRSFLNLFGNTGSATVYAALSGAVSTMTVDVSEKHLSQARANLSLNGYGGPLHQFDQADSMQWLKSCRDRYGLIFVDPSTFSYGRQNKPVFDIQKNHKELLGLAMGRLSREGILIFSNNYKKFKLDTSLEEKFAVEEITNQTIPKDFRSNRRIYKCWRFMHRPESGVD
jgi:23S rRNA (guanine2445-N2)-methyltransferase / 23S rRNA (guanine2069-N7)-methyltransferase